MQLTKIVFSYDRPMQLDGLCRSILHNSDLTPNAIVCICRSSNRDFRNGYMQVGSELGVRIVHENRLLPGTDLRSLKSRLESLNDQMRRLVMWGFYRLTTPVTLAQQILRQSAGSEFVSLAVDDMVYYERANFAEAAEVLRTRPDVALWSWRIGKDLQEHPEMQVEGNHWLLPHAGAGKPYDYVFHTDGSVYRRQDLQAWLAQLPLRQNFSLNHLESYLWASYQRNPECFPNAPLHAGPLTQASITWQINQVSLGAGNPYFGANTSEPLPLLHAYLAGARLDFSPLYSRRDWIRDLAQEQTSLRWTHVAPSLEAWELWNSLIQNMPNGRLQEGVPSLTTAR